MKHAGEAALDQVESLLVELRQLDGLRERKRGVFYRKSSALIHFHEDPAGIFADLRTGGQWTRLPVNTASQRRRLLRLIRETLAIP
jgi:hypothetical protein